MKMRKCDVTAVRRLYALMAVCGVMFFLMGCQSVDLGQYEGAPDDDVEEAVAVKGKKFTFTVKTDVKVLPMYDAEEVELSQLSMDVPLSKAASYLSTNTQSLTDLWVLDYMNGELIQYVHQTSTDSDWGAPTMTLAYGSHHVYFIASRGGEPDLDTDAHTIAWATVRDTFWKDYEVEVVNTTNGNRAVTLDRVITKFKATITDEIPAALASVTVAPATWYRTLDYLTGEPVEGAAYASTINVPASYVGTTGQLAVSLFSLSPSDDWTTDVTLTANDGSEGVLGQAVITAAPMKRNRATEYSGQLFGSGGAMTVSLNDEWSTPYEGSW